MRKLIALVLALTLHAAQCAAQSWESVASAGLGFAAEFPGKPEFTESKGDDGGMIRGGLSPALFITETWRARRVLLASR